MSCCCAAAKWKREEVDDHKFDFIDINTFYESSLIRKFQYSMIFLIMLKSVLVYIADLWTAGILLFFNNWQSVQPKIPLDVAKFIYLLCILCSYLLLIWDANKAISIVKSRDIGLAYTSPMAYRYYVLRNYAHYCFFSKINNSKKLSDEVSFFVFFTLKGWKRIIFAEAPRQVVNGFTIYAILIDNPSKQIDFLSVYSKADLNDNPTPFLALCLMIFVFVVFVFSAFLILVALFLYFPLLCSVRGNLKEFCCHKIDKRIGEMLKKESRKRIAKEARKDLVGALESGSLAGQPTLPTLPDVEFDPGYGYDYEYGAPPAEAYYSPRLGPVGPGLGRDPSLNYDNRTRNMSVISSSSSQYYNQAPPFSNSPRMGPSGPPHFNPNYGGSRNPSVSSSRGPPSSMGAYPGSPVVGPRRGNFP